LLAPRLAAEERRKGGGEARPQACNGHPRGARNVGALTHRPHRRQPRGSHPRVIVAVDRVGSDEEDGRHRLCRARGGGARWEKGGGGEARRRAQRPRPHLLVKVAVEVPQGRGRRRHRRPHGRGRKVGGRRPRRVGKGGGGELRGGRERVGKGAEHLERRRLFVERRRADGQDEPLAVTVRVAVVVRVAPAPTAADAAVAAAHVGIVARGAPPPPSLAKTPSSRPSVSATRGRSRPATDDAATTPYDEISRTKKT